MLSHEEARRVYDRIGALQDSQAFYEDRATDLRLAHGGRVLPANGTRLVSPPRAGSVI